MCLYVRYFFPCDYFSPFYVVICTCICIEKSKQQITLSEFFHISVYRFFSTSVAAIELFTISLFGNARQTFIVIGVFLSFFFSLSFCCCLMMFYVCKCVCGMLSLRETENLFFLVKCKKNKKERNGHLSDHTHIDILTCMQRKKKPDEHKGSYLEVDA